MSASETTKFQANFKTPAQSLINIYADTVVDGIAQMQELLGALPIIAEVEHAIANGTVTAPPITHALSEGIITPAQVAAAPAPAPQGHTCRHGAMVQRSGTAKNGKAWTGYFCPAPKGAPDQCEPQFVR